MMTFLKIIAFFVFISSSAQAFECSGNACDDVLFSFTAGCYVTKNHGGRRVKITQGAWSYSLQAGESHTLIGFDGQCVTAYMGTNTANYE